MTRTGLLMRMARTYSTLETEADHSSLGTAYDSI